jgi:hypothetical protein
MRPLMTMIDTPTERAESAISHLAKVTLGHAELSVLVRSR